MTPQTDFMPARAWLPDGAMADGTVERRLGARVAEWSSKWIASGAVAPIGRLGAAPATACGDWMVMDDSLALCTDDEARLALAGAMLDAPLAPRSLSAEDRRVADALASAALNDLCRLLAATFGFPAAARFEGASRLPPPLAAADARILTLVASPEAPPIRIAVAAALIVELRRSCVAEVPARLPLRPLAEALGRQQVSIAARLGDASLTVSELAQLAEGDVVLIDGDPAGELDLVLERRARCGSCALDASGDGYRLKIVQPLASSDTKK